MEALKNILVGFLVVALAVIVVGAVLQGFGFLYQHTIPREIFALGSYNRWQEQGSTQGVAFDMGVARFTWGLVTVTGLVSMALFVCILYGIGRNIRR